MTNQTSNPAAHANTYRYNLGTDTEMLDAEEFLDTEAEDVDLMTRAQRQALNARMADYFNG